MPSDAVRFLTVAEVLLVHERIIDQYGGDPGVLDRCLLESALNRPQQGHFEDIGEMAEALFEALLVYQPFVEGNRRVAFFATDVFLRLNGRRLRMDSVTALQLVSKHMSAGATAI